MKQTERFPESKPKWVWYQLKKYIDIQAAPLLSQRISNFGVCFTTSTGENQAKLSLQLTIDIQKSPMYCQKIGWNWHKSWNFPTVIVRAKITEEVQAKAYPLPERLTASLYVVKFKGNFNNGGEDQLEIIKGENFYNSIFKDGIAIFQNIRFESTSFFHKKSPFFLLINISLVEGDVGEEIRYGISSSISPPIKIDSRKQASTYHIRKKLAFSRSFSVGELIKGTQREEYQEKDSEQLVKLYNYFRSVKIRNKIKHPLYLLMRFKNAFKIFWNSDSNLYCHEANLKTLIVLFQRYISMQDQQIQLNQNYVNNFEGLQEKIFLIYVGGGNKAMKAHILKELSILDSKYIGIVRSLEKVDSRFLDISEMGNLYQAYESAFENIRYLQKKESKLAKEGKEQIEEYRREQAIEQLQDQFEKDPMRVKIENIEAQGCKKQNEKTRFRNEKYNYSLSNYAPMQVTYQPEQSVNMWELFNYLQTLKVMTLMELNRQNQLLNELFQKKFKTE